jgi:hypothetical protein
MANNSKRLSFRLSVADDERVEEDWKRRSRPDPSNPMNTVPFESKSDYAKFLFRCASMMNRTQWYIFSNILNPDYDQYKKY